MNLFGITAFAAGEAAAAQPGAGSMISMFLPFVVIMGVMYFLMIRPQKKKEKLIQEMLSQLVVGDKIITIGGIVGKIASLKGEHLVIETGKISDPSTIKIARWAISEVLKPADDNAKAESNEKEYFEEEE